ncbi:MAG: hypothetical protein A3F73_09560 [Gallionellales bacterium RIFCSPLOWO2_12_FULL_59_22]|nr:MAG: hypothetical protein A3H99_12905 [Gallionellales bacterium RIFCSPLOWO2_02_FULL_59_110]OGT05693.1 MAG: hypothetical protein A2Z65_01510 [Gallionellales bacterium RIFCSPLOWO2_02_58_13]OGT14655.1 MAG: hypothetical protein A3F73_09560 [Gallionellales bacterium RIFCSPLOWO2_12_FULL_59_22]
MALLWTKQLSVGNALLDADHKKLLCLVGDIEYAIETRNCHALLRALKRFMACMHVHFQNEERFARAINLPFFEHDLDHQNLRRKIQRTENELEAQNGEWHEYVMDQYAQFLGEWLIGHITGEDMMMKQELEIRSYDYEPG